MKVHTPSVQAPKAREKQEWAGSEQFPVYTGHVTLHNPHTRGPCVVYACNPIILEAEAE